MVEIRFKHTPRKKRHGSRGIYLTKDGQTRDVSQEDADHLLKHWPDNFEVVGQARVVPDTTPSPKKESPRHQHEKNISPPSPSSQGYRPPLREPLTLADITVIVINAYPDCFGKQLLPCIPSEVEFIPLENINNIYFTSAANALNYGIQRATNDLIMCVHVDTTLSNKWWESLIYWEARLEHWGAFGISGWDFQNKAHFGSEFLEPFKIHCLDEDCIVLNRKNGISFDEKTFKDWHCYGHDFSLQCWERGLPIYLVPGACNHTGIGTLTDPQFLDNARRARVVLHKKWDGKVPFINNGVIV